VGPKTKARLNEANINLILDVLKTPREQLDTIIGTSMTTHLRALARGEDDRPVVPDTDPKSISEERTYVTDLTDADEIDRALLARAEGVARELRRKGFVGRTIQIKVRTGDFRTWTRALTLPATTDLAEVIVDTARALLRERISLGGAGIRLLGVGISGLEAADGGQTALFADPEQDRKRRLAQISDDLRDRHGHDALVRARLLRRSPDPADSEDGGDVDGREKKEQNGRERTKKPRDDDSQGDTPEASSLPSVD
jgi:DNA polymerase-4